MGNCQATEAATVVIQHPGGRVERLYWPTNASEVMRSNPGHYVALVTLRSQDEKLENGGGGGGRHFTRVKLLRTKDTLVLGQVYRLVTSQEVTKGLQARRQEKMKSNIDLIKKQRQQQQWTMIREQHLDDGRNETQSDSEKNVQVAKQERNRQKITQSVARARQWRPSLQSISEAGS